MPRVVRSEVTCESMLTAARVSAGAKGLRCDGLEPLEGEHAAAEDEPVRDLWGLPPLVRVKLRGHEDRVEQAELEDLDPMLVEQPAS